MQYKSVKEDILDAINEVSDGKYIFVQDLAQRKGRWSKAAKEYFGLPDVYMDCQSKKWYSRIHPTEVEKYRAELKKVLNQDKDSMFMDYHVMNAKGVYMLCREKAQVLYDEHGNESYFVATITMAEDEMIYDSVSGLRNSTSFVRTIHRYNAQSRPYLVMAIDFVNFQEINTLYDYDFSSKVIYELAKAFTGRIAEKGYVYRIESTRFVFLIKDDDIEEVRCLFLKIRELCKHFVLDGNALNLEVVGGTIYTDQWSKDPQDILSGLAAIIEKVKSEAHYDLVIYDDKMHEEFYRSLELMAVIKESIREGCKGFYLCYQPFVSTITGKVIGAEALLRFRNEEFGEVAPYRFIDQIESHSYFYDLGIWILIQAVTDAKKIMEKQPDFFINVNMSYSQLEKPLFKEKVIQIVDMLDFPHDHLQLELTERCRNLDMKYLKEQLEYLKERGIKIALDDYGTGTSSIDMLCELPIDCVKIDQTFILNILKQNTNQVVVDTTMQCTQRLGLAVCLEGVENEEIRDFVERYSANYHQGYFYSRPVEFHEFLNYLDHVWSIEHINVIRKKGKSVFDINNILSIFPGAFFIYRKDENEQIITANEELLRMFECDNEEEFREVTNNSFRGIVHPDDYPRVVESINRQIANTKNHSFDAVRYRIVTKNGRVHYVNDYGHLVKNEYNEEVYYVFLAKDLEE